MDMNERKEKRTMMRKAGIAARDALSKDERMALSESVCNKVFASEEFRQAKVVLIYKGVRGEVRLEHLEKLVRESGEEKKLCYPLCIEDHQMIALCPEGEEAWAKGAYGIMEPIMEKSQVIAPEDIDLVVCPCTVFDENCNRMGMGAGYYDRYLPKCVNAHVVSVAFEVQKVDVVPVDEWDKAMEKTFTEDAVYATVTSV